MRFFFHIMITGYLAANVVGCSDSQTSDGKRPAVRQEINETVSNAKAQDPNRLPVDIGEPRVPRLTPQHDPTDKRVLALVAYFQRHGVRLVNDDADRWTVVEPEPPPGHDVTVSIKSFPESATKAQMRYALWEINAVYELNAPAHLAMLFGGLSGKAGRPESPSPTVRKRVQELFERYQAAGSPPTRASTRPEGVR